MEQQRLHQQRYVWRSLVPTWEHWTTTTITYKSLNSESFVDGSTTGFAGTALIPFDYVPNTPIYARIARIFPTNTAGVGVFTIAFQWIHDGGTFGASPTYTAHNITSPAVTDKVDITTSTVSSGSTQTGGMWQVSYYRVGGDAADTLTAAIYHGGLNLIYLSDSLGDRFPDEK